MTKSPLTARQAQVLSMIRKHYRRHGYPPTTREVGRALGLSSTSTVVMHLQTLARKGYLVSAGRRGYIPLDWQELRA